MIGNKYNRRIKEDSMARMELMVLSKLTARLLSLGMIGDVIICTYVCMYVPILKLHTIRTRIKI